MSRVQTTQREKPMKAEVTPKSDIVALKSAVDIAESEYIEASVAKDRAVALASEKWKVAAAATARYMRAKAKVELTQMRARRTIEAAGEKEDGAA